jgi:hypothetical protein
VSPTCGQDVEVVRARVSGARILMVLLAADSRVLRWGSGTALASGLILIGVEDVAGSLLCVVDHGEEDDAIFLPRHANR